MDASPLPFVASELLTALVGPDGGRLDANEPWRETLGEDGLWDRLPPDDARFASDYVREAAVGRPTTHQVFLVDPVTPGEVATPVLLHFQPVRLPELHAGQYPVALTGEVLREPESWAAEQTRRRRMEMLGQMSMGVAHDFNNLLTTVLGHSELLRADLPGNAQAAAHLDTLDRAARDGAALVRKIQGYIRNEKHERAEPVELHALVEEVLALTRPYWHNEPRRRGISIVVDAALTPLEPIAGTPTELREVLVNLVLNAVQAMPAGGTLGLATRRTATGAIVEVRDSGVGMTESVRRRIFEPLYTTKGASGTGMGLTVTQGIMQEHNGRIEVDSAPGQGTTFRLVFPFEAGAPAPIAPRRAPAPAAAEARPVPEAGTGARILVVDDEVMVRTVTSKLLRVRGYDVVEADGGGAALTCLDEAAASRPAGAPVDLVLTDLSMPGMSGRELAAEVRQRYPALPVLLLTGDTDAEAESGDVAAVVKKPFQLDALDATIRAALVGAG